MRVTAYWVTTVLLALVWLTGGAAELWNPHAAMGGMMNLGYPTYVIMILGFWKILGAAAILAPRFPRLKEWAYAGTFFELSGAAVSQAVRGGSVAHVVWPSALAVCALASWALRPSSRTLGTLFGRIEREPAIFATGQTSMRSLDSSLGSG